MMATSGEAQAVNSAWVCLESVAQLDSQGRTIGGSRVVVASPSSPGVP